jgi:hypothetical protein
MYYVCLCYILLGLFAPLNIEGAAIPSYEVPRDPPPLALSYIAMRHHMGQDTFNLFLEFVLLRFIFFILPNPNHQNRGAEPEQVNNESSCRPITCASEAQTPRSWPPLS